MSTDRSCPRCGSTVSESSLESGLHECDETALLERIEDLEDRVASLEGARPPAPSEAIQAADAARDAYIVTFAKLTNAEIVEEARQFLIDAMDDVEQEPEEEALIAALAAIDAWRDRNPAK